MSNSAKTMLALIVALHACFVAKAATGQETATPIVALSTPRLQWEVKEDGVDHPLLSKIQIRELWRQAVLLTAREEFGCATRDQSLAEALPPEAELTLSVGLETRHRSGSRLTLRHGEETLFEQEFNFDVGPVYDFKTFSEFVAPLTRKEIVDALEAQGLEPRAVKRLDSAPLPDDIEAHLLSTSYVAQFRAVRAIHLAIRESGESPERLNGLCRGYANLAQYMLTTLDERGTAYHARALLYAERLRHYYPDQPESQWCTAYVYLMGGFPTLALQHVELANQATTTEPPPAWAQLVDDACHHRYDELYEVATAGDELTELGMLFLFRSAFASGNASMVVATAQLALTEIPHCLCVIDLLHMSVGVSLKHSTTAMGPPLHARMLANELPEVEALPAATAELLDDSPSLDFRDIAQVARSLIAAAEADRAEPSWAVLGNDIEAWNVMHVFRRAQFVRRSLGSDASDMIEACEPAIEHNSWAPMIRTLAITPTARLQPYQRAIGRYRFVDANGFSSIELFRNLPNELRVGDVTAREAYRTASSARGGTEFLYVQRLDWGRDKDWRVTNARWMADSSLHAPIRIAMLLRDDEELSDELRAEWEEEHSDHPVVMAAMGRYYAAHDQPEKAIDLMEQSLAVVPDPDTFRALATTYYHQGDEKWLTTLARVLDHPDYALDHARAACTIASTLMRDGEFDDALEWAERASESGAGWAWSVECHCRTVLGQWEEAEALARQNSMRYDNVIWYDWCVDTGKGDLASAWRVKRNVLRSRHEPDDRIHEVAGSIHQIVLGEYDECLESLLNRADRTQKAFDMMWIVIFSDRKQDKATRDEWLAKMATHVNDDPLHPLFKVAVAVQQFLAAGDGEIEPIERAVAAAEEEHPTYGLHTRYFAGLFLLDNVSKDAAIRMWKPAAAMPSGYDNEVRSLVRRSLRQVGVGLDEIENMPFPYALPARPE